MLDRRAAHENWIALVGLFLSGLVALVCEIAWIRQASLIFGSTLFALSTVIAVFFGGLALGSFLFGNLAQTSRRPLRLYALLELAIGLCAAASPTAFALAQRVYGALYPTIGDQAWPNAALRFALVSLIVMPPAVLMGGSLPLFCRHFVDRRERISRRVGWLYAWNTLGATSGALLCGFVAIPALGLSATLWGAAAVSLLVALAVGLGCRSTSLAADPVAEDSSTQSSTQEVASGRVPSARTWVHALFFLSGALALSNEVLWTRYLALFLRNSVHTYTLSLSIVLLGIAAGSLTVARLGDLSSRRALIWGSLHVAGGILTLAILFTFPLWLDIFSDEAPRKRIAVLGLVLFPPALISGASFPLALRLVVERPLLAPRGVGRLTALNTAGGIVGSLLTGFWLLPGLGLEIGLLLTTGTSVAIGFCIWAVLERTTRPAARLGLASIGAALWLAVPQLSGVRLPQDLLAERNQLIDFREGRNASLAVVRSDGLLRLEINRLWQGQDQPNHQIMAAHVPMLLHPDARRVAVVGMGVGQTASRFLMYPDLEQLDCIELEHELIDLVREHFDSDWMDDPRLQFRVEDGRTFLMHTGRTYDLISIEIGQTFRPHLASFYTCDFYRAARERLGPQGMLCQFVPVSAFRLPELQTLLASFLEVFPESLLWYNTSELLLIGTRAERLSLDPGGPQRILGNAALERDLELAYWGGAAHSLRDASVFWASFLCGPRALKVLAGGAPLHTDDRPILEYSVAAYPPGAEQAIVEAIEASLGQVDELNELGVLKARLPEEVERGVAALRARNLRDIVAMALRREVAALSAAGRLEEALLSLERAHAENPENVETLRFLGDALLLQARPEESLSAFGEALRIDPKSAGALHGMAEAMRLLGRLEESGRFYERALEVAPRRAQIHAGYAVVLLQSGELAGALEQAIESLHLEPSSAEAHNTLGAVLVRLERPVDARRHFEAALALESQHLEARLNLARILAAAGEVGPAVDAYLEVLEKRPDDTDAQHALGLLFASRGDYSAALLHYEAALEQDPERLSTRLNLGSALDALGRTASAIEEFRAVLERDPELFEAHFNLAVTLLASGELEEAQQRCRLVIERRPSFAPAHNQLGRCHELSGELPEAAAAYRAALAIDPNYGEARSNLEGVLRRMSPLDGQPDGG